MNRQKHITLLPLLLLLAACAVSTPMPENESLAFRIYEEKCGSCHALPHPGRHSFQEWIQVVALMERRMEEKGLAPLSTEERDIILSYLERNARR